MTTLAVVPESKVETITPDKATAILRKNPKNRAVVGRRRDLYAGQMARSGAWRLNGQPIIIAEDGTLLDGQHRLLACIQAKTAFETLVVRGVDIDTFATIDQSRPRSFDDVISLEGIKRPESYVLASAIRLMHWLENGLTGTAIGGSSRGVGVDILLDVLERHHDLRSSARFAIKYYPTHFHGLIGGSIVAFMHYVGHQYAGEHGPSEFWLSVGDGAELSLGDPALTLRRHLISRDNLQYAGTTGRAMTLACAVRAWNAHCEGEKLQQFRVGRKFEIPLPYGYKLPKS